MEALKVSFFSFMSQNLTTKNILGVLTATFVYALRKKQLKTSFKDHFKTIIKVRHMSAFSFIILNYVQRSALHSLFALQKKQLIDFS